jgi:hypothetical protein
MNEDEIIAHKNHCCVLHGCKYHSEECPVTRRSIKQADICEDCDVAGLRHVPDPSDPDYDVLEMSEVQLRDEALRLRKILRKRQP